jgi:hypothetical protein
MKWICCLALTLALPLGAPAAQETPTLAPGTRVRVTTPNGRVVGALESIDSASIVLRRQNGRAANLSRGRGTRVDISAGPGTCSPGHRAGCVAVGFIGGAALGVGLGAIAISNDCDEFCGLIYLLTVPAGALVGTIVGAVVGGEHWNRAELPVRLSFAPGVPGALKPGHAVRVGVRLTF